MIVNDADKFGLAQLYQLRGRVGRSNHQAYCYLLYQGHKALTEDAKARLEAIREFTHLGSGLQIAMRDLEIRGAGNLLGAAQSGFIGSVGFDTYCQMLADAIAQRRGMTASMEDQREAVIDVKISAFIPNDYIPQVSQKIAVYQQLAKARSESEVEEIAAGVRDRFGAFPTPLEHLVELTKLRAIALAEARDARRHRREALDSRRRLGLRTGSEDDPDVPVAHQEQIPVRGRQDSGRPAAGGQRLDRRGHVDAALAPPATCDVTTACLLWHPPRRTSRLPNEPGVRISGVSDSALCTHPLTH